MCVLFTGTSVIQRPCAVSINTTVRCAVANKRHRNGERQRCVDMMWQGV